MSDGFVDETAEKALAALKEKDPAVAAEGLRAALETDPDRADLVHALAVTELRQGHPRQALELADRGIALAQQQGDHRAEQLMAPLFMARAAACEDLMDPVSSETALRHILQHEPANPRARSALGYLLLSWGRHAEGLSQLRGYVEDNVDDPRFTEAAQQLADTVAAFETADVHPKIFIEAHRGAYSQFFAESLDKVKDKGWIPEAARMYRNEQGAVVPVIPEGARPYAGTRVDLVDPASGQVGQVGDQPMVVGLQGYEALAQSAVLFAWPQGDYPFPLWISSQAPWNHLSVQIRLADPTQADALDEAIGAWYLAGYDGSFGTPEGGRLHEISDPEVFGDRVLYHVDCGLAEDRAVRDLLQRLSVLHDRVGLRGVLVGRGYLPVG